MSGCRVGVRATCVNQTMWLSVCVSAWAATARENAVSSGKAKRPSGHVNVQKVSAANYSAASLLVWQEDTAC